MDRCKEQKSKGGGKGMSPRRQETMAENPCGSPTSEQVLSARGMSAVMVEGRNFSSLEASLRQDSGVICMFGGGPNAGK